MNVIFYPSRSINTSNRKINSCWRFINLSIGWWQTTFNLNGKLNRLIDRIEKLHGRVRRNRNCKHCKHFTGHLDTHVQFTHGINYKLAMKFCFKKIPFFLSFLSCYSAESFQCWLSLDDNVRKLAINYIRQVQREKLCHES